MQDQTRVFEAKRIVTTVPSTPFATHVAVRESRVLGVGTAEQMAAFGPAICDDSFAGKVILPGFVEGHSHLLEGLTWQDIYFGFFDRRGPDGRIWPGLTGIEEVVAPAEDRACDGGCRRAADRLGLRPDLFRRPAHEPRGPRPGEVAGQIRTGD